ncbi:MAG TPA: ATP-binding protein [Vicinamibacterales bacterium]|nr:ATP-binding protein [Vicinamibacterales bacterium]
MTANPSSRNLEALASLGVAVVFITGAWLVHDREIAPLYVVAILLAVWAERPMLGYLLALESTVAILLTALVRGGGPIWPRMFGDVVAIIACWAAAFVVVRYRRGDAALAVAEQALGRSSKDLERIRYALDQSAIVAITDVTGTITYVNDKFCEISKYSRKELIGSNHRIINSGHHPVEFFREMYRTIGSGRVWRAEIRNRAKDGSLYWVDTTIVPFVDDRGRPQQYIAIRNDITARKASEATLRAQTALVQLGKMAAIVAHEVRNPLAGIRGAMQVIGKRLAPGSPEQGIAAEAVTRIDTLNDIVQDLLVFARPQQPKLQTIAVRTLLDNTVSLLREDPRFRDVAILIEPSDAQIAVDAEQVKLVLLNLLINSAQAMDGTGEIRVQVRRSNEWQELRVVDQGPGIPEEVREHLFEPFFTTKHRGTGLGLATARRIIQGHGGEISLDCPPTGGTIAAVRLPAP